MRIIRFALDLIWIAMSRRLVIVVLIALAFVIFRYDLTTPFFFPGGVKKNLAPSSRLVDDAAGEVARSIVLQCPQPENTYSQLLVLPVRNDRENAVENMIRQEFQKQNTGWYTLVEKDVMTRAFDQLHDLAFGKDSQKEITQDDAIRIAKAAGAELVLLSQIDRFVPGKGGHEISGASQLINVATGDTLASFPFDNSDRHGMMISVGRWRQYGVLVIFTLLWPILMIPVLRQVVARENNRDNLMTILIMAAVPLVVTLLLMGTQSINAYLVIGYCVFFALAAGWVGFVMDKITEK